MKTHVKAAFLLLIVGMAFIILTMFGLTLYDWESGDLVPCVDMAGNPYADGSMCTDVNSDLQFILLIILIIGVTIAVFGVIVWAKGEQG